MNNFNGQYPNNQQPQQQNGYPNYNNPYQQQAYYQNNDNYSETVSIGEWLIAIIVLMIPFVNIIMFIYWAIAAKNPSKKNFFRAWLALIGIVIVAIFLFVLIAGTY